MSKTPLYNDKHIQIFDDKIRFKSWALPWGKKDVMLFHIRKISEKFHFDASRPTKKKAIVLETDFKIYKRLWITPEKHDKAFSILKKLV